MSLLKVTDLVVSYGGIEALKGISFEVEQGQIVTLIGANGAGKSTTFKAILGLISRDGGEMELFGNKRIRLTMEDKRRIGAVLAEAGISGELTLRRILWKQIQNRSLKNGTESCGSRPHSMRSLIKL